MSLSKINIQFDKYKENQKSQKPNSQSCGEKYNYDNKKTEIKVKSCSEGSGIFNIINRDPNTYVRNICLSTIKTSTRKDYKGTIIKKKSKAHRVVFIDNISELSLIETVLIESFKEFNSEMSFKEKENNVCSCEII